MLIKQLLEAKKKITRRMNW